MKTLKPILNLCILCGLLLAAQFLHAQCSANAAFNHQHMGGGAVSFTNTSVAYTTSSWQFSNGAGVIGNSAVASPTFTYIGLPPYTATLVVSNDTCTDTLSVTISLPVTCVTLVIGPNGKDSEVSDYGTNANTNYGDVQVVASYIWQNGITFRERALLEFDFTSIPAGATVLNAGLSLYADAPTATFVGNPSTPMNGSNNASYIKRITSAWDEHLVTWNNQPGTTSTNQVTIPTSTNPNQDYIGLNITSLVRDAINLGNYGFMIQPVSTTPSNSMIFRSGDNSVVADRPTLQVCYILDSCTANASFNYNYTGGGSVQFVNTSTGASTSLWTFYNGNGVIGSSSLTNPSFTFSGTPPYSATLVSSNGVGCNDTVASPLSLPVTCLSLVLDSSGKDSEVSDYGSNANTNYGDIQVVASYIWQNGITFRERALLEFDFTSIPAGATIANASLSLYADDPTSTFVGNPSTPMNGSNNASYIRRITAAWDEHLVTWNTQPTTTTVNQIVLPTSTNPNQDYTGVDITQLVRDAINLGNNGFMIQPVSTTPSNSMIFRSGDHAIAADRPTLQVCYFTDTLNVSLTDTLCGMVYNDANNNGLFDAGENVRPNSFVNINGNVYYTDNTGFYRAPVSSGTHVITLVAPYGWVQTYPDSPLTYIITTNPGDYICGLDFGMRDDTLILSGIAYFDNNGNGLYDAGDLPRANVPVTITGINGNQNVFTNSQGQYSQFVYSGNYTVSAPVPTGSSSTQPLNTNLYNITVYTSSMAGLNFGVRNTAVTISGRLYVDANSNGNYDAGETLISSQPVDIGGSIVYTNSVGAYSVVKPAGTYTITYTPTGNYTGYTSCTPSTLTVSANTAGNTYSGNNFGICIAGGTGDVCVTLSQITTVTPALGLARYKIAVQNFGNVPMNGTLVMNFDPLLSFYSATTTPASVNNSNYTVTWQVAVGVGQTVNIMPSFTVPVWATAGTNVFNYVLYTPAQGFVDVNMACNEDTLHQQVLASYDPNDKYVSPIGVGNTHAILNDGSQLDYTIMFQNTGSAPAVNVILVDTIEDDLELSTFKMRDASHNYHVQIEGREITWIFSNIMLADSTTSADSSIGFVSFSMNVLNGLPNGNRVENRAGIYFDYNDVVATGTAFNTIDKATAISEIAAGMDIAIQPNPFTTYTNLVINGGTNNYPYNLGVYDMTGRLVQQLTSTGNVIRIERNNMSKGIYMYEVKQNGKIIGKGKLIAE